MKLRSSLLLALLAVASLTLPSSAGATCGGSTPFPQCDDVCPPGLVCRNDGGVCGCLPRAAPCTDPLNPNGAPVCYGSCPPSQPICATLAGGCACIPTLSEWGVIVMSGVMIAGILLRRRRSPAPG